MQDTPQPTAGKKAMPIGVRFTKNDARINRTGRPKSFNHFRALAQEIACKVIADKDGNQLTVGEAILRSWAKSKEPQLQRAFIEYAFGKVPDKLDTTLLDAKTTLILHYGHNWEKRDQDHQRMSTGLSPGAD
jgi:hypothetical protein